MHHLFSVCADNPVDGAQRKGIIMIELTRLNGEHMVVNSDLIRYAEASPDTVITLVTGDKIVVTESTQELIERVVYFRSRLLQKAFPEGMPAAGPTELMSAMSATTAHTMAAVVPQSNSQVDQDESWRRRRRETD
jgi:flagellar protein FlbD